MICVKRLKTAEANILKTIRVCFVAATSKYRNAILVQQHSSFAGNFIEIAAGDEHSLIRQTIASPNTCGALG